MCLEIRGKDIFPFPQKSLIASKEQRKGGMEDYFSALYALKELAKQLKAFVPSAAPLWR